MNTPAPTIAFEETEIEIGCTRRGRPSYRRARALFVIVDGVRQFPPMQVREAKRYAEQVREDARRRASDTGREDRQAGLRPRSANGAYLEGWHSGLVGNPTP